MIRSDKVLTAHLLAAVLLAQGLSGRTAEEWVPMRWEFDGVGPLHLIDHSPINRLLVGSWSPELILEARRRGADVLAIISSQADAQRAKEAELAGVVLEGDYSRELADRAEELFPDRVVELPLRAKLRRSTAAVMGTNQGLWPGIKVQDDGAAKSGPSGAPTTVRL